MPSVLSRPEVETVEFIVYDRPLHPELVTPVCSRIERHGGATLSVEITESGHRLIWTCGDSVLTELVGCPQVRLPKVGLAARHLVSDGRDVNHTLPGGFGYYAAASAERCEPEVFDQLSREIEMDAARTELSHCFGGTNRLTTPARSLLTVEPMDDSLVMHAVHTFPESLAIVRTQSLFELPA